MHIEAFSNEQPLEGAHVPKTYGKILGGIPQFFIFSQISQNVYMVFRQSIHKAFRIYKTHKQKTH